MIKQKAILLEDVPHYLNLHDCVEKELKRQGIKYHSRKSKDCEVGLKAFFE